MTSDSGVSVRRATAKDLDAVVSLRIALLREYRDHPIYGRLRANPERIARPVFATQLDSPGEATFLALVGGEPIGIIRCVETAASPLLSPDRYCYVSSTYVKPDHRRHGVLRALFDHAEEWCREHGLTEMRLHNVGSGSSAAPAWSALDFEVVEEVRLHRVPPRRSQRRASESRNTHPPGPQIRL